MKKKTISKSKNVERSQWRNTRYHKSLGLKAAKGAELVLTSFETERPNDARPRQALEAIRAWAQGKRELGMTEVRRLSLDAHAAAREAKSDAAIFAAHAAGQAVATWHVPTHAMGASWYAGKAMYAKKVDRFMVWFTTDHRGHTAQDLPRNMSTRRIPSLHHAIGAYEAVSSHHALRACDSVLVRILLKIHSNFVQYTPPVLK